jgi:predicted XRE-type DNA-binding protein
MTGADLKTWLIANRVTHQGFADKLAAEGHRVTRSRVSQLCMAEEIPDKLLAGIEAAQRQIANEDLQRSAQALAEVAR